MLAKCQQAVDEAAKTLGRATPTAAQYQAIEDSISASMRNLARQDPAGWQALSRDQQMQAAAFAAMWRAIPLLKPLGLIARNAFVLGLLERLYNRFLIIRPRLQKLLD